MLGPERLRWRSVLIAWAWLGMTGLQPALAADSASGTVADASVWRSLAGPGGNQQLRRNGDAPRGGEHERSTAPMQEPGRAAPAPDTFAVIDVELSADGDLRAVLRDRDGQPRAGAPVRLLAGEQTVATATTDAAGIATFPKIRPGIYDLLGPAGHRRCRVWAHGAAPPVARAVVVVESQPLTARGQIGPPVLGDSTGLFGLSPLVTLGVIAAAIAIPVGIAAANDDDGGSPPASP